MSTARLLVVDDEPLNQEIIAEYLDDGPYDLETADDGSAAWSLLQERPDAYDAVLLDRMMPNMDGIEVIGRMKQHPQLRVVPVIMQTAAASKDDVVTGLQAGAYYYLTKPFEEDVLRSIVDAAVEDHRRHRDLSRQVRTNDEVLHLMEQVEFSLQTLNEAHNVATFLANSCPDPQRVVTGFSELLVNGVEHGNLGITYDDKSRLNAAGEWEQEVLRRLADPAYADRRVRVRVSRLPDRLVVNIRDDGAGFEWDSYLEMDPARAFDSHGRGIAMARMLSFDKLVYKGCGNEVEVEVNLPRIN